MHSELSSTPRRRLVGATIGVVLASTVGLLSLAPAAASASQTLEVRDGDTALARISIRDQTRIRVDRGRITDVLGDIHDETANPGGRIALVKDDADGEIYVKPMAPAVATVPPDSAQGPGLPTAPGQAAAPIKLDIKSDQGTFALLLQPSDVVGDTLVLRPHGPRPAAGRSTDGIGIRRGTAHERAIKALTLAMANPDLASEFAPRRLPAGGQEVALWREARFVLKAVLDAPGLVGEAFDLTNVSSQRMVLDERELYREGVVSVSVKRLVLDPGETTTVWVLRQPAEND